MHLISLVILLLLSWLYFRWQKVKVFWARRNVPHHPPHPILGGLTFLQRENPAVWMKRIYKEFRTPYVGTWLFWRPALVINSPEIARRILVKDSNVFRNRFLSSGTSDPIGSLNLFTVNDPLWTYMRRRLTVVFTAAKLRALQRLITTKTEQLCERIRSDVSQNKLIDVRSLFADYTTDMIGAAAFGLNDNATITGESPLRHVTKTFMRYNLYRGLSWSSIFFLPEMVDVFRFSFFPKNSIDHIKKIYRAVVKERGDFEYGISEINDLLDVLRKIKYDAVQNREETLRMFPSMGWLDRIASTDYKIDDNLTIPAGTPVYVNAIGMHYDNIYYPNPEIFDPDRFMPENEAKLTPFTYMPFGGGPRNCIGQRFAYNTMRNTLASVVQNFKILPISDFPKPEECSIEKRGMFLAPDRPLSVQFIPRC
ncbi:cytochrome P450 6k1-like isoform X2 [Galleria mellonella]|uniref:unspecific monooxygenase n=1 Tax=Galleria mellonella TaxID=7137 RepID=A0A6J3BSY2_GALME|nr:cytochrome P450 6k1-like isoform X2 [Galleria mellonella]